MPFAYYDGLSAHNKTIYRKSDEIIHIPLAAPDLLRPIVDQVRAALDTGNRLDVQHAVQRLLDGMVKDLGAPPVRAKVLSKRPSRDWGELQGLYEAGDEGETALITVWMRTAAQKRVVAFKTFLRTVLHEICHHLDYETLGLEESFHTEGFFKRESSLFHQIAATAGT